MLHLSEETYKQIFDESINVVESIRVAYPTDDKLRIALIIFEDELAYLTSKEIYG